MLLDDNPCRTEHTGQQDEDAEPFYWIELEDEAVGQQAAYHHSSAGHVGTDFYPGIDEGTDDHTDEGGYHDAAHVAGQMNVVHGDQAGHVAQDGHAVGDKTFFAVSQFMEGPSIDFVEQVDAQHRHQDSEAIDECQNGQLVLEGHDAQVSKEKEQTECHKGYHEGSKDHRNDAGCGEQGTFRFLRFVGDRVMVSQFIRNAGFFHIKKVIFLIVQREC